MHRSDSIAVLGQGMDRSVAVGATSGSLSALLLRFVSEALNREPTFECPICPQHFEHLLDSLSGNLDPLSLLLGIAIGLSLGPIFDLIFVIRESWKVWVKTRLQNLSQNPHAPLYKLA